MKTEVPVVTQTQEIPEEIKPKPNRKPLIIIVLAVVVLIIGGFVVRGRNKNSGPAIEESSTFAGLPEADKNIVVEMIPVDKAKVYTLTISKIPKEVTSIEYEMQYKTEGPDGKEKVEGIFGAVLISGSDGKLTKEVILGTESSGVRRYHKLTDGKATLTLKFVSPKGASRLQKQFNLL